MGSHNSSLCPPLFTKSAIWQIWWKTWKWKPNVMSNKNVYMREWGSKFVIIVGKVFSWNSILRSYFALNHELSRFHYMNYESRNVERVRLKGNCKAIWRVISVYIPLGPFYAHINCYYTHITLFFLHSWLFKKIIITQNENSDRLILTSNISDTML